MLRGRRKKKKIYDDVSDGWGWVGAREHGGGGGGWNANQDVCCDELALLFDASIAFWLCVKWEI